MIRFFFFFIFSGWLFGQEQSKSITLDTTKADSLIIVGDKLYLASKDSIDVPVDYQARDSIIFDMETKLIYLFGEASIKYQTMELKADYIIIDMNKSVVVARPLRDSSGIENGVPKFKDREQSFDAKEIKYNFKSRRGLVSEVVSKESDIFIHGEKSKFLAADSTNNNDQTIYNHNGIFTTCDAEVPHYGIYSKKQKIIPNKLIIIGPSIVKIHGVPAPPLMLPFGFFPISQNKTSGLLFPKNYVYDNNRGFGLQDVGYYFPISDYYDLKLLTSIWFKGSYKINVSSNYKLKYKYDGKFYIDYANISEEKFNDYHKTKTNTVRIYWHHGQLSGAHPNRSFGGTIDLSLNPFDRIVNRDFKSVTNNQLSSNLNFVYNFPNSPFTLTAGLHHDQNLNTRVLNVSFPDVNFNMRTINPFKNNKKISQGEKWYEKITLNYSSQITSQLSTYDSILFSKHSLDTLKYGVKHSASMDVNFKAFKYFNLVPLIRYNEEWFFKQQNLQFNPDTIFRKDTLRNIIDTIYGSVTKEEKDKFSAIRTLNASLSMNTQIYGQILAKKGWFRGIRHVVSPSISMGFAPDYRKNPFNYFSYVDTDSRPNFNVKKEYLRADKSPFGTNSVPSENFIIGFNVSNRIEMKYFSRRDTQIHKLSLLDNFSLGGSYNVNADSFKLSRISGSGRFSLLKNITTVNFSMSFDPYDRKFVDRRERRIDQYIFSTKKKLAILEMVGVGISSSMTIPRILQIIKIVPQSAMDENSLVSLFKTFNISHQLQYNYFRTPQAKDSFFIAVNSLSTNGSIDLTPKWRFNIGNIGYDIRGKTLTYPDFGFERDLHCWIMKFNYRPQSKSFTFFIGVKPGSLEFIKIPANQNITGSGF